MGTESRWREKIDFVALLMGAFRKCSCIFSQIVPLRQRESERGRCVDLNCSFLDESITQNALPLCFGTWDYFCCCRQGLHHQWWWTVNPSWPYGFGEIYEGWIDRFMFTAGLISLIQRSIHMHRGLGARRHLMQCVRRALKKRLSKIKMSILPQGHTKKNQKRRDKSERNISSVCVIG